MDFLNWELNSFNIPLLLISLVIGACIMFIAYLSRKFINTNDKSSNKKKKSNNKLSENGVTATPVKKGSASTNTKKNKSIQNQPNTFAHPWLVTSLKSHTSEVTGMDFSSNGKYLATCAEDRTVLLWSLKDLNKNIRKTLRVNISYDYAKFVKWSPDSKAFVIVRQNDLVIEVYKVEKKKDSSGSSFFTSPSLALTYPRGHSEFNDIVGFGIASNGKYIMTCSENTDMLLWDLKGGTYAKVDTYLMNTWCAKITPCGRFVVASGFAPDVKIWEVVFSKSGEFQTVKRAYELTGHTSGIYDVAFDQDTSHMATVSKDGTWKLFQTNIEYHNWEDPHLLITAKYNHPTNIKQPVVRIALSPNAEVVVISVQDTLLFYSALDGILDRTIDMNASRPINCLLFESSGKHLYVAVDRHIRIFHNVTGYKTSILTSKAKLKLPNQTNATRERIMRMITENEEFLKNIGEKLN